MSFTQTIKKELCDLKGNILEYTSELSSIIRNNAIIENNRIIITVENKYVAKRIITLIDEIYDIKPTITIRKRYHFNDNLTFILEIKNKVNIILKDLSIVINDEYQITPKEYLLNDEECLRAYLRGLFISTGSINDPKTSGYHLEFIITDKEYANYISKLLNNLSLNNKIIRREKNYMLYIKEAEKIGDFLRIIKAYNGVMYFEDIRIYRDYKNMNNRINNCEIANMDKVFITANKQLKEINILKKHDMIDLLDNKLKEAIEYREKYMESSLQELSEIMTKELGYNISKSGLNHRFRKIKQIATRLENKN